jgi:hypothetical protein
MNVRRILPTFAVFAIVLLQFPLTAQALSCDLFTVTPNSAEPGDVVTID